MLMMAMQHSGLHKHIHNTMHGSVTHKCTVHDACNRADHTCYSKCLLEWEATNMAVEGTMLGAKGAPM